MKKILNDNIIKLGNNVLLYFIANTILKILKMNLFIANFTIPVLTIKYIGEICVNRYNNKKKLKLSKKKLKGKVNRLNIEGISINVNDLLENELTKENPNIKELKIEKSQSKPYFNFLKILTIYILLNCFNSITTSCNILFNASTTEKVLDYFDGKDSLNKEELNNIPEEVLESELTGRTDLTSKMIFTIDGADTKDIDDAISLEIKDNIYTLGVHIADVSHYVLENTALGDEAYSRGTSSYLADTVIPMLPHKLSNGICSLNEGVIRLTMSCVMDINQNGDIINYDIFPSFIKSRKKMTYDNVNEILENNKIPKGYEEYAETLKKMHELATILRKKKVSRGYIEFDIPEAKIIQDENGKAIDIKKRVQRSGEALIEDFMIAANETVATHISNMELPFIYRVHDLPNNDKIEDFLNLVKALGYNIKTNVKEITPKTMQKLLEKLKDKKEFYILSTLLLRSMKKAVYSKTNIGHFGLASKNYTHFTSPIRRFPDLTVHRLLKKYLIEKDYSISTINYLENSLVEIADHSSERELASTNAERDVNDMKMAEYMESHIGEEYDGIISSVTSFGFFVELPNLVEGLVHISTIKGDYYEYVPELLSLIGKSTKKTYRIGDKIKVKVINASKETAQIDFEIVGEKW